MTKVSPRLRNGISAAMIPVVLLMFVSGMCLHILPEREEADSISAWTWVHNICGILFLILAVVHNYLHWGWFKSLIKTLKGKDWCSVSLAIMGTALVITSIVIWLTGASGHDAPVMLHDLLGRISVILCIIHIFKKSKVMCRGLRQPGKHQFFAQTLRYRQRIIAHRGPGALGYYNRNRSKCQLSCLSTVTQARQSSYKEYMAMKQEALLLDRPEDFKHYGINPNTVEEWEDGVRDTSEPNHFEWWYFDCMLDDGTKVVIQFLSKNGRTFSSNKFHPTLFYKVTTPDGRQIDKELHIPAKEIQWSKETCDVHFGKHSVCGNLKEYKIHIDLVDGMGADLTLKSTSKPYRPGTSYFQFGTQEQYYTWLCVVPRGTITGTVTVEGNTKPVTGTGYHDHQWGSINFHKYWNHWIWARQSYEDCSLLLFDFFTNEEYGTKRFPIIFIQDNEGNLIFESHDQVECRVEKQYTDDASGKVYPKALQYVFRKGETTVEYHLQAEKTIECKGKNNLPLLMKLTMKLMRIQASYSRYTAKGDLSLKSADRTIGRSGALIYEIMCPGEKCVELMNRQGLKKADKQI